MLNFFSVRTIKGSSSLSSDVSLHALRVGIPAQDASGVADRAPEVGEAGERDARDLVASMKRLRYTTSSVRDDDDYWYLIQ
jgi:hypothetical protein